MRLFDIAGIFFVALWVVGITAFFLIGHDDGQGRAISLTDGDIEMTEDTVWMTVYRAGDEVGTLREDRTRLIDGWLFEMQGVVLLDLVDDTYAFRFISRSTLNNDLTLRSAMATVEAFGMTLTMDGQFREDEGDAQFVINVTLDESTRRFVADLEERPRLSQHAIPQILATEELDVGDRFEHEFFDPLTLSPSTIQLEYEGTTDVSGYEGTYEGAHSFGQTVGSLHSRIRTDSSGMVLQQILPMQVAIARIPEAIGPSYYNDFEEIFEETFDDAPPFVDAIDTEDLLALVARFGSGEVDRLRDAGEEVALFDGADDDETKDTGEFYFSALPDTDRVELMSPRQHIAFSTSDEARVETALDNPLWHAGDAPPNSSYEPLHASDEHDLVAAIVEALDEPVTAALADDAPLDTELFVDLRDEHCADVSTDDVASSWPSAQVDEVQTIVDCMALIADALSALDVAPHFVHGARFDGDEFHERTWLAIYRDGHYLGEFDLHSDGGGVDARHVQFYLDDAYDPELIADFVDSVALH